MSKVEVIDLTRVSRNFPKMTSSLQSRNNYIDTVEKLFQGDTDVLLIEGEEGIGKTTFLSQFALRYPNNTISLFINSANRLDYHPEIVRMDFCNQLNWLLHKTELCQTDKVNSSFLRSCLFQLQRSASRRNVLYNIVIDGLSDIPKEDRQFRDGIIDMLPIGSKGFRFLISVDIDKTFRPFEFTRNIKAKTFWISGFNIDETRKYLSDFQIDIDALNEIRQTCRGIPGRLSSVKRILNDGMSVKELIDILPNTLPDLFNIEWSKIDPKGLQENVLAIIAHGRQSYTVKDISRITKVNLREIETLLNSVGFISLDEHGEQIAYISNAFKTFAATKTQHLRSEVISLLINDLLNEPESESAISMLPEYLNQEGRYEEILEFLTPQHFRQIVEASQSLIPVQQKANLGLDTATNLSKDGDVIRFSMHLAAMSAMGDAQPWRSELEARVALNDYGSALSLAQGIVIKEERLQSLAAIARAAFKKGSHPEASLIDLIRTLYSQIEVESLTSQASELASDLLFADPSLAVDLLERATATSAREGSLDWAFAKLSLTAHIDGIKGSLEAEIINKINDKITDPALKNVSSAASILFGDFAGKDVIEEIKKLNKASDQIGLLRLWLKIGKQKEGTDDVIEYAIDLILKTTEFSPDARVICHLANPLPLLSKTDRSKKLVGLFEGLTRSAERLGPTLNYVKLQLNLASTEVKFDIEAAKNRLIDTFLYSSEIAEYDIKAAALANLDTVLKKIDPMKTFDEQESLHDLTSKELQDCIEVILKHTANQFSAIRGVIRALSSGDYFRASQLASRLNTEDRRNNALNTDFRAVFNRHSNIRICDMVMGKLTANSHPLTS